MFHDRREAGERLAEKLKNYQHRKDVIILAIPRGGVPVAYEVAKSLDLPLDLIIIRKLPLPENPESGIGAVSETGKVVWHPVAQNYPPETREKILQEQKEEVKRRISKLRAGRVLPSIKNKTVILIDDGLAMGSTMSAAIATVRMKKAKKVIVAVPVAGAGVLKGIKKLADEVICLEVPVDFYAVAQAYENWYDLTDEEVIKIMG